MQVRVVDRNRCVGAIVASLWAIENDRRLEARAKRIYGRATRREAASRSDGVRSPDAGLASSSAGLAVCLFIVAGRRIPLCARAVAP